VRRPPAVARVLERVTKTARRYEMFEPGDLVLACVSGGPDSVCLVETLVRLRRLFKFRVEVFHLDHRLRGASGEDAEYVRRLARRLGVPFHPRTVEGRPSKGASVEAWATSARSKAVSEVRASIGATVVAEGHTMNDRAETVLIALVRGGGLEAVAGIRPVLSDGKRPHLVQPLIDVKRSEVESFCRSIGLRPRIDQTNRDRSLLRNAIRLDVIPALERATGREVIEPIARTASLLASDARELLEPRSGIVATRDRDGAYRIDPSELRSLPENLAARVVRGIAYEQLGEDQPPWSKEVIESVVRLASARPGSRVSLPAGSTAWRSREYVHIARAFPEAEP
jgi:tRNA(Ile)-lysidine synthetase-like protein